MGMLHRQGLVCWQSKCSSTLVGQMVGQHRFIRKNRLIFQSLNRNKWRRERYWAQTLSAGRNEVLGTIAETGDQACLRRTTLLPARQRLCTSSFIRDFLPHQDEPSSVQQRYHKRLAQAGVQGCSCRQLDRRIEKRRHANAPPSLISFPFCAAALMRPQNRPAAGRAATPSTGGTVSRLPARRDQPAARSG